MMKTLIKTSIAATIIAAGALGATAALSWGGQCDGPRGGRAAWSQMEPERMQAQMAQRAEVYLARLELALALTPEQRPAFESFKSDIQARAARMGETVGERRSAELPGSAIERLQRMEEFSKQRQEELAAVRSSAERFYATLSDAQKTVFDSEFQRIGRDGGRNMRSGPRERSGAGAGRS